MLAAGIDPTQLDIWYLPPGIAAVLSLLIFLWAWQISVRHRLTNSLPSQSALFLLYKLNALKNGASFVTIFLGFMILIIYYAEHCLLPEPLAAIVRMLSFNECAIQ
jgi:hypothetical protein